jgi:hypothetical protein
MTRTLPAGLRAQVTIEGVPSRVLAGTRHPARVTVRNTGSVSFDPVGPGRYSYRLGVRARDRRREWPPDRVDFSAPLRPGDALNLPALLTAPRAPGSYELECRMVLEMVGWFGKPSGSVLVEVEPFETEVLCLESASTMVAGRVYGFSLEVRNRSRLPLGPVGPRPLAFRLGLVGSGVEAWGPRRAEFPEALGPGQTIVLRDLRLCPAEPGRHELRWQLLQEGSSWLGNPTDPLAVHVLAQPSGWTAGGAVAHFDPLAGGEPPMPTLADVEEVLSTHWRFVAGTRVDGD